MFVAVVNLARANLQDLASRASERQMSENKSRLKGCDKILAFESIF